MWLKWLLALACCSTAAAQIPYQNITGSIQYPLNGVPFTGRISIQLAAKSGYNICASPATIVPSVPFDITVTNGLVTGGPYTIVPSNCLAAAFPYFVQIFDDKGVRQWSDNWYLPQALGNTIDIGTLIKADFGGPIQVAVPAPLLASSNISQVVNQPNGTNFTFNVPVNFTKTVTGVTASTLSSNGAANSYWGMNSAGTGQGWFSLPGGGGGPNTCTGCAAGEVMIWNGTQLASIPGFKWTSSNNFLDGRTAGQAPGLALSTNFLGAHTFAIDPGGSYTMNMPYNTATGAGLVPNLLACLQPDSTVHTCPTNATFWNGITFAVSGTAQMASLDLNGYGACLFDNTTALGDFAVMSIITAGQCHDSGSTVLPVPGVLVGQITSAATSGVATVNIMRSIGQMYVPPVNSCGTFLGNGCTVTAGNVMQEWGTISYAGVATTVTFNVPFTHGVQSVQLTPQNFGANPSTSMSLTGVTTVGFNAQSTGATSGYYWVAVGLP